MDRYDLLGEALRYPGAYVDHPFGADSDIVKLCGKIAVQLFELRGQPAVTFKCEPMEQDFYRRAYPQDVTWGYHCPDTQKPYFMTVRLGGEVPDTELRQMLQNAFAAVQRKLTKRQRTEYQERFGGGNLTGSSVENR